MKQNEEDKYQKEVLNVKDFSKVYNGSETVLKMKLLGANDDMNGGRGPSSHRSQDDAAVGYVFQRHPHETADFPHFSHKQAPQQPRWASGDETIIDVSTHLHLILFFFF